MITDRIGIYSVILALFKDAIRIQKQIYHIQKLTIIKFTGTWNKVSRHIYKLYLTENTVAFKVSFKFTSFFGPY